MVASGDIELEGVTTFATNSSTAYRYSLSLKDGKLNFSMEDRSSKKQWFKGGMDTAEFVTADNAISGASAADYLKCFHEALSCALDGSNDSQRRLSMLSGDTLRVELVLKLRVLNSTWDALYKFALDPVDVERIDILESKLRDQQDELRKIAVLEAKVQELQRSQAAANAVVELKATGTYPDSTTLRWGTPESQAFVNVNDNDGVLTICRSGLYLVCPVVNCLYVPCSDDSDSGEEEVEEEEDEEEEEDDDDEEEDGSVRLLRNGECIQAAYLTEDCNLVSPKTVARFQEGDKLMITANYEIEGTSTLCIVRLGD